MTQEFKTVLPQIAALRSTINVGVNSLDGTAQASFKTVDVFSMPTEPPIIGATNFGVKQICDRTTLTEKILRLRSKYAIINAELEQDIVQIIIEEIGQGFKPK